jgi:hypothetical protein
MDVGDRENVFANPGYFRVFTVKHVNTRVNYHNMDSDLEGLFLPLSNRTNYRGQNCAPGDVDIVTEFSGKAWGKIVNQKV